MKWFDSLFHVTFRARAISLLIVGATVTTMCAQPEPTSVCEGREPVVRQVSDDDYAGSRFTGRALCGDGTVEWWWRGYFEARCDPSDLECVDEARRTMDRLNAAMNGTNEA